MFYKAFAAAVLIGGGIGAWIFYPAPRSPVVSPSPQADSPGLANPALEPCAFRAALDHLSQPKAPSWLWAKLAAASRAPITYAEGYLDAIAHPISNTACLHSQLMDHQRLLSLTPGAIHCEVPGEAADFALFVKAEPKDGRFHTELNFTVGLGPITPQNAEAFALAEIDLVRRGYGAWDKAFPSFAHQAQDTLALSVTRQAGPTPDLFEVQLKGQLLPQQFYQKFTDLSLYLINLVDLLTIDIAVTTHDQPLFKLALDTVSTEGTMTFLTNGAGIATRGPQPLILNWQNLSGQTFQVGWDITVIFSGLHIVLKNMAFKVDAVRNIQATTLNYQFLGVKEVEVSGAYHNISLKDLKQYINTLVKTRIDEELTYLAPGPKGGFTGQVVLAQNAAKPFARVTLNLNLPFSAFMLLAPQEAKVAVLPTPRAKDEFYRWLDGLFTALEHDSLLPCKVN